jgi:hypothetical protein
MTNRLGAGGALLIALASCQILSLPDIEKKNPSVCAVDGDCVDGWTCGGDGHCHLKSSGGMCSDGDTQACGSNVGECKAGTATCSGGTFGSCMGGVGPMPEVCDNKDNDCNNLVDDGISDGGLCALQMGVCQGKRLRCVSGAYETSCSATDYGPDYEATETKCDGLDNDCDGLTDQNGALKQNCAKQDGVCAGTQVICGGASGFPACTDATYMAHAGANYEPFETKCDGLDNDCDGLIDAWDAQNVSASPGHISRNPVGVTVNTESVLVMWEEEQSAGVFKVSARVVHKDGTMTPTVLPASTVTNSTSSATPAVATDGTAVFAAWSEVFGTTSPTYRLQMAPLDPTTGLSTLTGNAALQFGLGAPQEMVVAVDATASRVLVAWVVSSTMNVQEFSYTSTTAVPSELFTTGPLPTLSDVQDLQAAPAGNNAFWLTYQTASTGQMQRCLIDSSGKFACTAGGQPTGLSPIIFPLNQSAPLLSASLFLKDVDAGIERIISSACDAGTCTVGQPVVAFPPRVGMDHLRGSTTMRNTPPSFFAWQEGGGDYHWMVSGRGDGGVQPGPGSNPGRNPLPVFTGVNRGAVIFDTNGVSSGSIGADDVYLARYCL